MNENSHPVASSVQAVSRRTPHSLIMGSLAGFLMQKYGNILAPSFMHAVQWLVAIAIFLYLLRKVGTDEK